MRILKLLTYGTKLIFRYIFNRHDEETQCELAEKISHLIYPRYIFSDFGRKILYEDDLVKKIRDFQRDLRSTDRKYTVIQFLKLVDHLTGDTAECGVYEGATSYFICKHTQQTGKTHHIFDSFEGLSEPSEVDGSFWRKGSLTAEEQTARKNLSEFGNTIFYKGWIPERFNEVKDVQFSFVHIDVDLYQPTFDSLAFFYDRLQPEGIIICDDYDFIKSCPGARKAMDDFFKDKPENVISLSTGQGFIIKKS